MMLPSYTSSRPTLLTPYGSRPGTVEEEDELALLQRLEQLQMQPLDGTSEHSTQEREEGGLPLRRSFSPGDQQPQAQPWDDGTSPVLSTQELARGETHVPMQHTHEDDEGEMTSRQMEQEDAPWPPVGAHTRGHANAVDDRPEAAPPAFMPGSGHTPPLPASEDAHEVETPAWNNGRTSPELGYENQPEGRSPYHRHDEDASSNRWLAQTMADSDPAPGRSRNPANPAPSLPQPRPANPAPQPAPTPQDPTRTKNPPPPPQPQPPSDTRLLTEGEKQLVRSVFGNAIKDLDKVEIRNRKFIFFQPRGTTMTPKGNIYPAKNLRHVTDFSQGESYLQDHLIHEMTHVWQHQNGMNVLMRGLVSAIAKYDYVLEPGKPFERYPMEQQATIVEDYLKSLQGKTQTDKYRGEGKRTIHPPAVYEALIPWLKNRTKKPPPRP